ncbi:MAG: DUF6338 family protein [Allosphingosinicella sp.]
MPEIPSASQISGLAALLAPGVVILGIRSRFKDGPPQDLKDALVAYGIASTAYYAVAHPIFHTKGGINLATWLWQLLQYFIVPSAVGIAIVLLDKSDLFYKISSTLGLKPTHHIPAAWDYAFSRIVKGTYVLVRLKDGTLYAGLMGKQSFASSAFAERDLYIEEVWSVPTNTPWKVVEPRRSVLLCGNDIRWVEIFRRS